MARLSPCVYIARIHATAPHAHISQTCHEVHVHVTLPAVSHNVLPMPMHSVWEEHVRKEQRIIKLGTEFHLSDARKRKKQGQGTKWGAPGWRKGNKQG